MKKEYKITKNGYILHIFEDNIESPRDFFEDTNIAHFVCFGKYYGNGDEHEFEIEVLFEKWAEQNEDLIYCKLPLYKNLRDKDIELSLIKENSNYIKIGYICVLNDELKLKGYIDDKDVIMNQIEDEISKYNAWQHGIPRYYSFEVIDQKQNMESMGVFEDNGLKDTIKEMKERSKGKYNFLFDALLQQENDNCL